MTTPAQAPLTIQLPKLLQALFHDAERLLFQQAALLRAEATEAFAHILRGSAVILAGLEIGLAGLVIMLGALVAVAAQAMPLWVACLLIGTVVLIAALALIAAGRRMIADAALVPRRTARSLRDARAWLEDELT